MSTGKVLVLGDDTRSFLATVRSLGRRGLTVHVVPGRFTAPALRSRYIAAIHRLPPWMQDGREWLAATEALLRAERYDLVIPCNETALLPLHRSREQLALLTRLAIPDQRAIEVLFDKHATRELARSVGVPVADGGPTQPGETAEAVLARLGSPVVVKPRHSYVLDMLDQRGKVQVLRDPAQLAALLPKLDPERALAEAFFPGQGLGVSLLAHDGRVLQAFEHHRVREEDGGSYYRISAPLTPALLQACEAMVGALRYTGLAMFEFKRNPDTGAWILLEVNARPWGSMPLPVALGVDFPWFWYRLLVNGVEEPQASYPAGIYGRNLIPDLRATLSEVSQARAQGRPVLGLLAGRLLEPARWLTGREVQDTIVRDDPMPGLAEIGAEAAGVLRQIGTRVPGSLALRRALARRRVATALREAAGAGRPVLFVCQGNICRSPFAEALLRRHWSGDAGAPPVGSCGTLPRPGRPTPEFGIAAASAQGIDLRPHRSRYLASSDAEGAGLIVVFDEKNRISVADSYPELAAPVVKLGDLTDGHDIADPVDGDQAMFDRVYGMIERGVRALAALR